MAISSRLTATLIFLVILFATLLVLPRTSSAAVTYTAPYQYGPPVTGSLSFPTRPPVTYTVPYQFGAPGSIPVESIPVEPVTYSRLPAGTAVLEGAAEEASIGSRAMSVGSKALSWINENPVSRFIVRNPVARFVAGKVLVPLGVAETAYTGYLFYDASRGVSFGNGGKAESACEMMGFVRDSTDFEKCSNDIAKQLNEGKDPTEVTLTGLRPPAATQPPGQLTGAAAAPVPPAAGASRVAQDDAVNYCKTREDIKPGVAFGDCVDDYVKNKGFNNSLGTELTPEQQDKLRRSCAYEYPGDTAQIDECTIAGGGTPSEAVDTSKWYMGSSDLAPINLPPDVNDPWSPGYRVNGSVVGTLQQKNGVIPIDFFDPRRFKSSPANVPVEERGHNASPQDNARIMGSGPQWVTDSYGNPTNATWGDTWPPPVVTPQSQSSGNIFTDIGNLFSRLFGGGGSAKPTPSAAVSYPVTDYQKGLTSFPLQPTPSDTSQQQITGSSRPPTHQDVAQFCEDKYGNGTDKYSMNNYINCYETLIGSAGVQTDQSQGQSGQWQLYKVGGAAVTPTPQDAVQSDAYGGTVSPRFPNANDEQERLDQSGFMNAGFVIPQGRGYVPDYSDPPTQPGTNQGPVQHVVQPVDQWQEQPTNGSGWWGDFWNSEGGSIPYNGQTRQFSTAVPFSNTLFRQSLAASAFGAFFSGEKNK